MEKGILLTAYADLPPDQVSLDKTGSDEIFPIGRIYCVGKNYRAYVVKANLEERDPLAFVAKPRDSLARNGGGIPCPAFTNNLEYEREPVAYLKSDGCDISEAEASKRIFGCAAGCDTTRSDLRAAALPNGPPRELAKAFDHAASVEPITLIEDSGTTNSEHMKLLPIGERRQDADTSLLARKIDESISKLSEMYEPRPGDKILTGAPAGAGAVKTDDMLDLQAGGFSPMQVRIGEHAA